MYIELCMLDLISLVPRHSPAPVFDRLVYVVCKQSKLEPGKAWEQGYVRLAQKYESWDVTHNEKQTSNSASKSSIICVTSSQKYL